jgi:hypothetical protein
MERQYLDNFIIHLYAAGREQDTKGWIERPTMAAMNMTGTYPGNLLQHVATVTLEDDPPTYWTLL